MVWAEGPGGPRAAAGLGVDGFKSQLIATSSCLKTPRVPHMNDLTMSGHLGSVEVGLGPTKPDDLALTTVGALDVLQTGVAG